MTMAELHLAISHKPKSPLVIVIYSCARVSSFYTYEYVCFSFRVAEGSVASNGAPTLYTSQVRTPFFFPYLITCNQFCMHECKVKSLIAGLVCEYV